MYLQNFSLHFFFTLTDPFLSWNKKIIIMQDHILLLFVWRKQVHHACSFEKQERGNGKIGITSYVLLCVKEKESNLVIEGISSYSKFSLFSQFSLRK